MRIEREKGKAEIPTASMADIAFLLIVFFMLTTVFSATKGMDFTNPKDEENEELPMEADEAIWLRVEADGRLYIDKNPGDLRDIQGYVQPKLEQNPEKPVIIDVDPQARYENMANILDELKQIIFIPIATPDSKPIEVKNIVIPTQEDKEMWGIVGTS